MRGAAGRAEERASQQIGLFGAGGDGAPPPLAAQAAWGPDEELHAEHETVGFFITGHPLDRYLKDLKRVTGTTTATLRQRPAATSPWPRHARPDARPRAGPARRSSTSSAQTRAKPCSRCRPPSGLRRRERSSMLSKAFSEEEP